MKINADGSVKLSTLFPHKDVSVVNYYSIELNNKGEIVLRMFDERQKRIKNLPTKQNISCTENLVAMTRQETHRCWEMAKKSLGRKYKHIDPSEVQKTHKEELNQKYRDMVCKLPTDVLESILLCHRKEKFCRAEITISSIINELATRTLLNDSSHV